MEAFKSVALKKYHVEYGFERSINDHFTCKTSKVKKILMICRIFSIDTKQKNHHDRYQSTNGSFPNYHRIKPSIPECYIS